MCIICSLVRGEKFNIGGLIVKKQELSKMLIKDSEYYNSTATYVRLLKSKKINTIEELFNTKLDDSFFIGCSYITRAQLLCLVSVLRYKYFNEPLYVEPFFDKSINIKESMSSGLVFSTPNNDNEYLNFARLFGCQAERVAPVFSDFKNYVSYSNVYDRNIRLIDFLRWISKDSRSYYKYFKTYSDTYIESYDRKIFLNYEAQTLEYLKAKLVKLMDANVNINSKIRLVENQIDSLTRKKR